MSYATTDQLKSALSITDSAQDTYLTDLLARASAWIDTYTGRHFATGAQTVTDELHEGQGSRLWLKHTGITEITSVEVRDVRSDDWEVLGADDYEWTASGRLIVPLNYTFVKVTYKYDSNGVPKDIEMVAVRLATQLFRDNTVSKESLDDYSIEHRIQEIAPDDLGVLAAYRVRNV
ncbi:phage head-tail connector protein [Arthrobacter sp. OY3WO11]|uniref:phage head-tail connector protein n=1 Tax=Arthrobacter sp. OY3WO11 TaxID=1835723 RepID=UPI0007D00257|nr:phage head-tail connector protein [Arthrobacter sp. OY3WO11]OAE01863.1 hypothetical protein A6A22_10875 [Arthrobacter sp. OY3WO11]